MKHAGAADSFYIVLKGMVEVVYDKGSAGADEAIEEVRYPTWIEPLTIHGPYSRALTSRGP